MKEQDKVNNKYFVRKVIDSKFKEGVVHNLVLETFLDKEVLVVNIEKGDEVIWTKSNLNIPYLLEEKQLRRIRAIKLGEEKFKEL